MAGRRGFPLCFCGFARQRGGESLRCAVAEDNMLRLRAVQPVGVAENDEADDKDHGDRADGVPRNDAPLPQMSNRPKYSPLFSAGMIFAK